MAARPRLQRSAGEVYIGGYRYDFVCDFRGDAAPGGGLPLQHHPLAVEACGEERQRWRGRAWLAAAPGVCPNDVLFEWLRGRHLHAWPVCTTYSFPLYFCVAGVRPSFEVCQDSIRATFWTQRQRGRRCAHCGACATPAISVLRMNFGRGSRRRRAGEML